MKIGVLDIQGSVEEHVATLQKLREKRVEGRAEDRFANFEIVKVKNSSDVEGLNGLIIPGGESTVIGKLIDKNGLFEAIKNEVEKGMAIWGTCAGLILLANKFKFLDIEVERNAYGRQINSFEAEILFDGKKVPAVFIRAPKILKVGKDVEIIAKNGDEIVAVRKGKFLGTTFHPELTTDLVTLEFFINQCMNTMRYF